MDVVDLQSIAAFITKNKLTSTRNIIHIMTLYVVIVVFVKSLEDFIHMPHHPDPRVCRLNHNLANSCTFYHELVVTWYIFSSKEFEVINSSNFSQQKIILKRRVIIYSLNVQ
jgi:hypothetical protein